MQRIHLHLDNNGGPYIDTDLEEIDAAGLVVSSDARDTHGVKDFKAAMDSALEAARELGASLLIDADLMHLPE